MMITLGWRAHDQSLRLESRGISGWIAEDENLRLKSRDEKNLAGEQNRRTPG